MAAKDPATVAQKWANNLSAAANSGAVTAGINAVTTSPGQAAARQKGVWLQNVTASADTWASNVAAVTLPSWQSDTINKGVPRIATGATAAEPKFQTFMGKLLTNINSAKSQLPPRGTFTQNLQRANQMATALHNTKGQYK